jgi:prophage antirepressor-like protein
MNSITLKTHSFNNHSIDQLTQETRFTKFNVPAGYVNATQMCKAGGKRWNHYASLDSTKAYWEALSAEAGIPASAETGNPVSGLVISIKGGNDKQVQGTWVHPEIAIDLAQWVSVEFRIWANRELKRVIEQTHSKAQIPHNPPKQVEPETIPLTPELPDTAVELKFKFEDHEIRFIGTADDPWWAAADICTILEISTDYQTRKLDDWEKRTYSLSTTRGRQKMLCVNRSGFFALILASRKPQVKRFKKWVISVMLPLINRIDSYSVEPEKQQPSESKPTIKEISAAFDTLLPGFDSNLIAQIKLRAVATLHPELATAAEIANKMLREQPNAPTQERQRLSAEELAQVLTNRTHQYFTASQINKILTKQGFQREIPCGWNPPFELTRKGEKYGRIIVTALVQETAVKSVRWFPEVLEAIEI